MAIVVQKQGGGSKKGRIHSANLKSGKYLKQKKRTRDRKVKTLKLYLKEHPDDIQNKKDIEKKLDRI